jgi:hypothetical protein
MAFLEEVTKQEPKTPKFKSKRSNAKQLRVPGATRLWIYAIIVTGPDSVWYIKMGDHRCESYNDVISYCFNSVKNFRGLMTEDNIIGIWDMTDHAISVDPMYDPNLTNYRKGYDNHIRPYMPFKKQFFQNFVGGRSLEVHPVPEEFLTRPNWLNQAIVLWDQKMQEICSGEHHIFLKTYDARPYLNEALEKITHADKFLLGPATGSGKEAASVALVAALHDKKQYKNDTIHAILTTIPSTLSETLNEIATLNGINTENDGFIDFTRIKPYITQQWYDAYKSNCNADTLLMINQRAVMIDSVSDIPEIHENDEIPVLFAGYHDVAQKSNNILNSRYVGLENRIGVLLIGEAHVLLGSKTNKMWMAIEETFGQNCFKVFVSGTPYDFIFSGTAAELFDHSNRVLFTRDDIFEDKRTNPDSPYKSFPDMNTYALDVKDLVSQLKTSPLWVDDAEAFTFNKLFNFTVVDNEVVFTYESSILWFFKRLVGRSPFNPKGDALSIYNAPGLCSESTKHILTILPNGNKDGSASVYIKALKQLLIDNGIFNGKIFDAYDDNLRDRKDQIEQSNEPTLTLTCIKDCTGANIPKWGSVIFLRSIGDSVNFFEQATGRVCRQSPGKSNCGIFIADLEASINVMITVAEKLAADRNTGGGSAEISRTIYNNYDFFTQVNGGFVKIDEISFNKIYAELAANGKYGIQQCININTLTPSDFLLSIKNTVSSESAILEINNNGTGGKTVKQSKSPNPIQLDLFDEEQQKQIWNNFKLLCVAKCRIIAFIRDVKTVADCVKIVKQAIIDGDSEILSLFDEGIEFVELALSPSEIDTIYTNLWIEKFVDSELPLESLYMAMEDSIYKNNKGFVALRKEIAEQLVNEIMPYVEANPELTVLDPCGGRGILLIYLLNEAKKRNLTVKPENVFYRDIDHSMVSFFKRVNTVYNLGIPTGNISEGDIFDPTYDPKVNVIISNPAYSKLDGGHAASSKTVYPLFIDRVFSFNPNVVVMMSPARWFTCGKNIDTFRKQMMINTNIKKIGIYRTAKECFNNTRVEGSISYFLMDKSYNGNCEFISIENNKAVSSMVRPLNKYDVIVRFNEAISILDKVLDKSDSFYDSIVLATKPFGLRTTFSYFVDQHDNTVLVHGRQFAKHTDISNVSKNTGIIHRYKTILSAVFGAGVDDNSQVINRPFVIGPGEICTETYVVIDHFDNETLALNLATYMQTKFFRFMVLLRKISQHNPPDRFAFVPVIDLSKSWNDAELYNLYNLSETEISFIESSVRDYK